MKAQRFCSRCRESLPVSEFSSSRARRCTECSTPKSCVICGTAHDPAWATCHSDACVRAVNARNGVEGARVMTANWRKRLARRTTRRCSGCTLSFPLTEEFFTPIKRDPETGEALRLHSYCRPCSRVNARLLWRMNDEYRERAIVQMREYRDRVKAGEHVPNKGTPKGTYCTESRVNEKDSGGYLPAEPFVVWLKAVYTNAEFAGTFDDYCQALGISPRNVRRMYTGEQRRVSLDTVDRALVAEGSASLIDLYPDLYAEAAA